MSVGAAVHNFDAFRAVAAPARVQSHEDPYERVLGRLEGVKVSGKGHKAKCPAHEDRQPSLSINRGDNGEVLLHCHAGCGFSNVVAGMGLDPADLYPPSQWGSPPAISLGGTPVVASVPSAKAVSQTTYDYTDAQGNVVYQTVRKNPKGFYQRRPDGRGGHVKNLSGVQRVLYQLPALLAADPAEPVFIAEGEKDVDNLRRIGCVATTSAMGAGKWIASYGDSLLGRDVVILPDNDKPGREHGYAVAHALLPVARTVKVLDLPGLPEKGDVSDWLAGGGTAERLRSLADLAPPFSAASTPTGIRTITAADLVDKTFPEARWAVRGIIPEGLTLFVGAPKKGKSWLCLNIGIAVASGWPVLGRAPAEQGDVLYLALEDTERRLQQRLLTVLEGEPAPARLHFVTEWRSIVDGGIADLDVWLAAHPDCRLVIVDTLARMRAGENSKSGVYQADYAAAGAFKQLADRYGTAFVLVHHVRKAEAEDPFDAVSGTNGLTGAADTTAVLRSLPGRADASLYIRGRDVPEDEHALTFNRETCTWSLVGRAEDYRLTEGRAAVVELLRGNGSAMTPRDIADALGTDRPQMRTLLSRMAIAGQVVRVSGAYSLPPASAGTASPFADARGAGDALKATGGDAPANRDDAPATPETAPLNLAQAWNTLPSVHVASPASPASPMTGAPGASPHTPSSIEEAETVDGLTMAETVSDIRAKGPEQREEFRLLVTTATLEEEPNLEFYRSALLMADKLDREAELLNSVGRRSGEAPSPRPVSMTIDRLRKGSPDAA